LFLEHSILILSRLSRRSGRVAEGAPLLRVYTLIAYRGFESLLLRHIVIPMSLICLFTQRLFPRIEQLYDFHRVQWLRKTLKLPKLWRQVFMIKRTRKCWVSFLEGLNIFIGRLLRIANRSNVTLAATVMVR
jgi:hypothetical protein